MQRAVVLLTYHQNQNLPITCANEHEDPYTFLPATQLSAIDQLDIMHIAHLCFLPQQTNQNIQGEMAASGTAVQSMIPAFNIVVCPCWMLIGGP